MQDTKKTSRAGFRELQNGKINKTYLHSKILFFQLIYCHKYRKILCQINFQKHAVFGNYTICNLLQFHRPAVRPAAVKRLRRVPATRPARKLHFAISTPAEKRKSPVIEAVLFSVSKNHAPLPPVPASPTLNVTLCALKLW